MKSLFRKIKVNGLIERPSCNNNSNAVAGTKTTTTTITITITIVPLTQIRLT
jgi:hypothetical protein